MANNVHQSGGGYDPNYTWPSASVSSSASVILYRREASPLLSGKPKRTSAPMALLCPIISWCIVLVMLSITVYHTFMHSMYCPPDASTRDAIRQEWGKETAQHAITEREWQRMSKAHEEARQEWRREAEEYKREVVRRTHEEHERQARVREDWRREVERQTRKFEEMQRQERLEMERQRQEWKREREEHQQREEQERIRLRMYWGHVEELSCISYATREYTAQLMNLPRSWENRVEACRATPLEVHGISYLPKSCEDRGPGVVIGRWEVNQQEPACTPCWEGYTDNGCTSPGSGRKHVTHKLMNLPKGSNWQEFCATTPIHFDHLQFPGAQECFENVFGVYGRWEIDDHNC